MNTAGTVVACVLMVVTGTGLARESTDLARRILQAVDRPVGLAHLPRCGEGSLAVALAAADENLPVPDTRPRPERRRTKRER